MIACREVQILRDAWRCAFDFETRRGEWIGVVGPSGAGKSTLLETIVGFVTPDSGEILIDGNDVSAIAPARRRVAYMFQQDSLFGHLTVETNLALALHDQELDRQTVRQRVGAALNDIGLDADHGRRKPSELSGGERARVNLARALLRDGAVLLLDEPFSSLDQSLRREMLEMTSRLHRQRGLTTLCVTHHIDDALIAADRLLVVEAGAVLAFAPPGDLARHPPTREVARLLQMGTVFDDPRGTCWYLLPHEFITDRVAAETLKRPVQVPLPDATVQFLGTCQMVRETTSGRMFRIQADARFHGELFFDSATAWKLPGTVAGT